MKKSADGKNIVIIGSGIGGLSAGILLSILNYDVTIVEKNPLPGGLMRSYRRAGINCPVGVHYTGALGNNEPLGRIFRLLGINVNDLFERMGQDGVIDRYIFDDFTFDLPPGIDAYEEELKKAFPDEKAAIAVLAANLRKFARLLLDPSFLLNQGDLFRNIEYFDSMGEYVQKLNLSDNLRSVLAVPAYLIGVPLVECPLIFHHMVLAGYLFSCWRLKENGGKMADVFVHRFTELGGKLILNDGAKKIFLKSGKAAGLQLESGCSLPAEAVIAAIHPKTLLPLLPPEALKKSYRQRILGMEETEGVIVVQVSVDIGAHQEMPYNIYRLHPGGKGILKNGIFCQLRRSNAAGKSLLTIITKSLYDDWNKWKNTKPGERGLEYEEKKLRIAQDLLQASDKILGKLTTPRIIDVFTPLTLRDYVNCAEGSCYGLMHSSSQLLKIASLNNVPLPGLYLAGQNVVAPGVLGTTLGSFNAASKIAGTEQLAKILQ